MNYDYPQTDLSRGILSGLFAGLIAVTVNIVFVVMFRIVAAFYEFNGLDITVIIFGSIIQSIACGLLFYFFVHYLNRGVDFYRLVVLIVTVFIVIAGIMLRHSVMGDVPNNFKYMVVGTQVVIGGLALFFIPYLFRHDKIIS
jgi:hypothetical protein